MKMPGRITGFIGVALPALLLSSCGRGPATPTITTTAAGHTITAEIEGKPDINSQPGFAVIGGPYGRVTLERERVRLDELAWTAIPADVPVSVSLKRGHARIVAGSVTITRTVRE